MPEPRLILCLILICLAVLARPALANTAVVRGGEHHGFTRLTIVTDQPTAYLSHRKTGETRFEIDLSTPIVALDTTRAFERLSAGRVEKVEWSGTQLSVELTCDCAIEVSNYADDFLIVDISEVPGPSDTPDATERRGPDEKLGGPFGAAIPGSDWSPFLPSVLDLDPSMIERVSVQISSQLLMGRPSVKVPQALGMDHGLPGLLPERVEIGETRSDAIDCRVFHDIWRIIDSGTEVGAGHDDIPVDAAMARVLDEMEDDRADHHLANLIATGLLTEAHIFTPVTATEAEGLEPFRRLATVLRGKPVSGPISIDPACGLFAEMTRFVMLGTKVSDMTNDHILMLYHGFEDLPLGLKLALFPAFEPVLTRVSAKGFDALYAHRAREVALLASTGLASGDAGDAKHTAPDPDYVAAVARELRGTDAERASRVATVDAYLSGHRYLDAVSALDDLPEDYRSELWSRLLRSLAESADPITFLSVSLTAIEERVRDVPMPVADRVMARLLDDGFPEAVLGFFDLRPEYARDEGLMRKAAVAQLALGEPAAALQVLGSQTGLDADRLRAEAFAALDDPAQALAAAPEGGAEDARPRWQWLAGQYRELADTGADTPQAELARLLSDRTDTVSGPITVASAQERVETSTLIRQSLADLLRKDP